MISCTEFIPAYSALFDYLEKHYGEDEVHRYWNAIFVPEKSPLNALVREYGIAGCYKYWSRTLNEEAADFELLLNEKDGWFMMKMYHCPSKGRLLDFEHVEPYHDYCHHCDQYRRSIEPYGLRYDYDYTDTDRAACRITVTDPKKFRGTMDVTPDTVVMRRTAADNKYCHRDFHTGINTGVEYLGSKYGTAAVRDYLRGFALSFYAPTIGRMKKEGLAPLREQILNSYASEDEGDKVSFDLGGDRMTVRVSACPAVAFMKGHGVKVSEWYPLTTEAVMAAIAEAAGYAFEMKSYNAEDGAAEYSFERLK